MNHEGEEQCVVIPGGQEGEFQEDVEGNKWKHSGEEDDGAGGEEGPEQKKRKSSTGGASGCSQGILAFKEDGKKYYQCKMSDCIKVRSNYVCCV